MYNRACNAPQARTAGEEVQQGVWTVQQVQLRILVVLPLVRSALLALFLPDQGAPHAFLVPPASTRRAWVPPLAVTRAPVARSP